jgi:hypothetical protein
MTDKKDSRQARLRRTSWNDNTRVRMTSGNDRITNKVISMKTLIIKSLLTSLCQREVIYPSLEKRGKGRLRKEYLTPPDLPLVRGG